MDGIIEQKNLMYSKINDAGKRNGLINTRNFMAESRDGLVSVYPTPQYQNCRLLGSAAAATLDSGRSEPVQQLLDPNTLQQSVESHYHPNIILYSEGMLRSWGDGMAADCCETTFIEDRSPTKESLEYPDGKFIDLSADDIKIHTLSYDVEEEEEFQDLECFCNLSLHRKAASWTLHPGLAEAHACTILLAGPLLSPSSRAVGAPRISKQRRPGGSGRAACGPKGALWE
uniref:Synapse differentiation inducing 1 n=1 Tax=Pipistrellus kuhlii TaxID=59472 RepID=A0A7J7YBX2_PIPKU|nr:synapse differentiation inducing 1 [Pipistrellus kuhlii]